MRDDTVEEPEEVVRRAVSHYEAEELADGRVKVKTGGMVSIGETYYDALISLAEHQKEHIENLPEHLREDRREGIHDIAHPNLFIPVVIGITQDGDKQLLRVCDTEEGAETVKEAFEPGGTIMTSQDFERFEIETVKFGTAR